LEKSSFKNRENGFVYRVRIGNQDVQAHPHDSPWLDTALKPKVKLYSKKVESRKRNTKCDMHLARANPGSVLIIASYANALSAQLVESERVTEL
jgi:DNA-binding sugar fermentation-stimulating protein